MGKRYTVMPHLDVGGYLRYLIIDTGTGRQVGEQDCLPWAERKAAQLNNDEGEKMKERNKRMQKEESG